MTIISHDLRPRLRETLAVVCLCGSGLLVGCRTLPWRCPSEEHVVAAREQGRLGLDALHRGQLKEAETRLKHALERCPRDAQLHHDLALVRWEQGAHDGAIEAMDTAVRDACGEPQWTVELGDMLLDRGATDVALEAAERALQSNHKLGEAWRLRGDIMTVQEKYQEAVRDYHRALSCGVNPTPVLLALADVYRLQGRPQRALATLQRLEDTAPSDDRPPRLDYLQAIALQALGRHEDAVEMFRQARQIEGDHPDILLLLARSHWQLGHVQAAVDLAQLAADQRPSDARIQSLLQEMEQAPHQLARTVRP